MAMVRLVIPLVRLTDTFLHHSIGLSKESEFRNPNETMIRTAKHGNP